MPQRRARECAQRPAVILVVACRRSEGGDLAHLGGSSRKIAPPRRCTRAEEPPLERGLELVRAEQELARTAERLARQRTAAGARQDLRRLVAQLGRRLAVELGEQMRCLIEVERADLQQL